MVRVGASGPRRDLRLHRGGQPARRGAIDMRISDRVRLLARLPRSGRRGRVEGTRELVITRTPYIVAYRIIGDTVRILRVLHSSRQWPDDMPDG
jgi:toxin ParE1/3/4